MANCVVNWQGKEIKFKADPYEVYGRMVRILPWLHKRKFPNVTEEMQQAKCEEEIGELGVAYGKYILEPELDKITEQRKEYYFEMADVWFAISGMYRFNMDAAEGYLNKLSMYPCWPEIGIPLMIEKLLEVYFIRTYVNNRHI